MFEHVHGYTVTNNNSVALTVQNALLQDDKSIFWHQYQNSDFGLVHKTMTYNRMTL
jgi:hypothetical protein